MDPGEQDLPGEGRPKGRPVRAAGTEPEQDTDSSMGTHTQPAAEPAELSGAGLSSAGAGVAEPKAEPKAKEKGLSLLCCLSGHGSPQASKQAVTEAALAALAAPPAHRTIPMSIPLPTPPTPLSAGAAGSALSAHAARPNPLASQLHSVAPPAVADYSHSAFMASLASRAPVASAVTTSPSSPAPAPGPGQGPDSPQPSQLSSPISSPRSRQTPGPPLPSPRSCQSPPPTSAADSLGHERGRLPGQSQQDPSQQASVSSTAFDSGSFASSRNSGSRSTTASGSRAGRRRHRHDLAAFKPRAATAHPVEPPNLKRKIRVGRDKSPSWRRQIMYGEATSAPSDAGSASTSTASVSVPDTSSCATSAAVSRCQSEVSQVTAQGRPLATIDSEPGAPPPPPAFASRTASGTDFRAASRAASKRASRVVSGTDFRAVSRTLSKRTSTANVTEASARDATATHPASSPPESQPEQQLQQQPPRPPLPEDVARERLAESMARLEHEKSLFKAQLRPPPPDESSEEVPVEDLSLELPQPPSECPGKSSEETLSNPVDCSTGGLVIVARSAAAEPSPAELLECIEALPEPPTDSPGKETPSDSLSELEKLSIDASDQPSLKPEDEPVPGLKLGSSVESVPERPAEPSMSSSTEIDSPEELSEEHPLPLEKEAIALITAVAGSSEESTAKSPPSPVNVPAADDDVVASISAGLSDGEAEAAGGELEVTVTALVLHPDVSRDAAPATPRPPPLKNPLGGSVQNIADYRAAARLKYEETKRAQQAEQAVHAPAWDRPGEPGELKSLRELLRLGLHDAKADAAEPSGVQSVQDAPGVHKSEDIESRLSSPDTTASRASLEGSLLQSPEGDTHGSSGTDSTGSGHREDTFESDEGLIVRIRSEHKDEAAVEAVEAVEAVQAQGVQEQAAAQRSAPDSSGRSRRSAAVSSAMVAAFVKVAAAMSSALGAAMAVTLEESQGPAGPPRRDTPALAAAPGPALEAPEAEAPRIKAFSRPSSPPCPPPRRAVTVAAVAAGPYRSRSWLEQGNDAVRGADAGATPWPAAKALPQRAARSAPHHSLRLWLDVADDTLGPHRRRGQDSAPPSAAKALEPDAEGSERKGITSAPDDEGEDDDDEAAAAPDGSVPISTRRPPAVADVVSTTRSCSVITPRTGRSPARSPSRSPAYSLRLHRSATSARSVRTNMEIKADRAAPLQRSIVCGISTRGRTIPIPVYTVEPISLGVEVSVEVGSPQQQQDEAGATLPSSAVEGAVTSRGSCGPNSVVFPSSMVDSAAMIAALEAEGRTGPPPVHSASTPLSPPSEPVDEQAARVVDDGAASRKGSKPAWNASTRASPEMLSRSPTNLNEPVVRSPTGSGTASAGIRAAASSSLLSPASAGSGRSGRSPTRSSDLQVAFIEDSEEVFEFDSGLGLVSASSPSPLDLDAASRVAALGGPTASTAPTPRRRKRRSGMMPVGLH